MGQPQLRKDLGLDQIGKIAVHRQRGEVAQQPDARVGVAPLLARGVIECPLLKVGLHLASSVISGGNCRGSPPAV